MNFANTVKRFKFHSAHILIRICRILPGGFYRNAAELGQSVDFSYWVTRQFGPESTFFATREKLWDRIISGLKQEVAVTVFEFGVADGRAAKWWLSNCSLIDKWFGFDSFTGLPRKWRHFQTGAFNCNGKPPEIEDSRVKWITGKVEDTFSDSLIQELSPGDAPGVKRMFIFDMDLYEPTKHVLKHIFPHLKKDDILYFDEAADWDERRALLEMITMDPQMPQLIGATPTAIALRVGAG